MTGAAPERSGAASSLRWIAVGCSMALLLLLQLSYASRDSAEATPTSYGKVGHGFGALYDLLHELKLDVSRSRLGYDALPTSRPLWLLAPNGLRPARGRDAAKERDEPSDVDALLHWVERGGTAVVFGDAGSDWSVLGLPAVNEGKRDLRTEHSSGLARRALRLSRLQRFATPKGDDLSPLLLVSGEPFALRRALGDGQLIAVADARILTNQSLAEADHSLVAMDLVRAFGAPVVDEFCHGLVDVPSFLQALRPARIALLAAGLGLLGILVLWRMRAWPAAERQRPSGLEPGLSAFVESLALLYSRKVPRHAAAIARAYQQGVRHRMQRALGHNQGARGPAATPPSAAPPVAAAPSNRTQLEQAVRAMERDFAAVARTRRSSRLRPAATSRQEP